MKKHIQHQFLTLLFLAASLTTFAQVGINTTTPEGALDIVSTNSGMVFPRVANTAAVTSPVNGMMVYDLSSLCLKGFEGGNWSGCLSIRSSASVLAQIGLEADDPDVVNSVVTVDNLRLIEPELTGLINSKETDYQNYIDGNPNLFSSPATQAEVQAMIDAIIETDVVSTTGKIWMDRDLGATQVATSSTDADAYGDLYQWGRNADGHESRTSATIAGPVTAGNEGSDFITSNSSPFDWLNVKDDTRWNGDTKGAEDPCPSGYRVPTETEWSAERLTFISNNADGAYKSALKLTVGGYRAYNDATLTNVDVFGRYWCSTVSGADTPSLRFDNNDANIVTNSRAFGNSVRCIKE